MGEIKKQSINNSLLSYIGAALGFITIYFQPHLISSSDIGLVRLVYSFSWLAAITMPLGMVNVTMRFFPKFKNPDNANNGYFAVLLLIASIGAVIIGLFLFLQKPFFIDYYKKSADFPSFFNEAVIFAYILSLISVLSIYSSSLLKTTITVFLTDVFIRVGQLILVVLYHYNLFDQYSFVMFYMGLFLLQLIILILFLISIKAVSFRINWKFFREFNLKEISFFAVLMMLTAFASLGIKFIDQLMLGHFLSENYVGIYATCVMMCVVMEIPFNSLERIAQPKIAHAWNINDVKEVSKIYEMSSRYMFFIGGVLFCLLWAGIDVIFMFLPNEYQMGKTAFCIISFSSLINLLTGVNSSVILLSNKYFTASVFLFIMILISYFANNALISSMGISGAAYATLIAIGIFNILKYLYILYKFKMQPFSKHTLYISSCTLLSIGVILMLPDSFHPLLKAFVGGGFTVLIFSFMNIRFNTIEEVNKLFKRFKLI